MKQGLWILAIVFSLGILAGCARGTPDAPLEPSPSPEASPESAVEPVAAVDEDYYATATGLSRTEVEEYAKKVKQLFFDHDWAVLSEEIAYPVTIGRTTYYDSGEFTSTDFEDILAETFFIGLGAESCEYMYCIPEGIMLGMGEVWIGETSPGGQSPLSLKIIEINGLVE